MDTLAPIAVEPLLRGLFGRPYLYLERCETTQRMLDAGFPEGAVAVCEEQTGGRGRHGRSWDAPARSSILVSILLRPATDRRAAELTLVAGLATALTLQRITGLSAQVKWPNDVLLDGRKVSGGIAELLDGAVVVGIGLNVNQEPGALPGGTKLPAGSLRTATGREHERPPILAELLLELERLYEVWRTSGIGTIAAELGARDYLRGRLVSVGGAGGGVSGIAAGITNEGLLEVRTDSGPLLVESGEVGLRVDVGE
jgi:BirA family transcriptional regulator, biotin operon repressor / biotin---[acetyl-CoA-carboxylase] ligase